MPVIKDNPTIPELLEQHANSDAGRVYLRFEGSTLTLGELNARASALAAGFAARGIGRGDRVAIMLGNHPDHVATFFALIKLGAVQVPVNTQLRGASLDYLLQHCEPCLVVADACFAESLESALKQCAAAKVIWRRENDESDEFAGIALAGADFPARESNSGDVLVTMYTSGTTGPPKGVMVTDKMMRAAAWASGQTSDVTAGDTFFVWDPLYHIGGVQALLMAVEYSITLALVRRFSASRFWSQVREHSANKIHYLGGIVQILLRQPPRDDDRDNAVSIAWGGGAPASVREPFEQRFGVQVRENYGMTEASSLTTIGAEIRAGAVGRPPPYFDVQILDADGNRCAPGEHGEIVVRGREPGLITPGYFRNPEATAALLRDGWLRSGDVGYFDDDGFMYYAGRLKDSIRRRGENISAWEIERVVDQLEWVQECAAIGVPDELGDEEVQLFVKVIPGAAHDSQALFEWCERKLARFQVPAAIAFVDAFDKTATQRIQKESLPNSEAERFRRSVSDGRAAPE